MSTLLKYLGIVLSLSNCFLARYHNDIGQNTTSFCKEGNVPQCDINCVIAMDKQATFYIGVNILYGILQKCTIPETYQEKVCSVDVSIIAKAILQEEERQIPSELYTQLICQNVSHTRVIFTNRNNINDKEIIAFLVVNGCNLYWKDLSIYGQAFDFYVFISFTSNDEFQLNQKNYHQCVMNNTNIDLSYQATRRGILPAIKGLERLGTLVMFNSKKISITPVLGLRYWPKMAEIKLKNIKLDQTTASMLPYSMPYLQSFEIENGDIILNQIDFPWLGNTLDLPRNLSRSERFQVSYSTSEGIAIGSNIYRRIYAIRLSNLTDLCTVTFSGLLHKLDISHNKITMVGKDTFKYLEDIQVIDVSHNLVTVIPLGTFKEMASLRKLYWSNNHIKLLKANTFEGLRSLEELDLNNNHLQEIGPNALGQLPNLLDLDISYNFIQTIDDYAVEAIYSKLQKVNLSNNQLQSIPYWIFVIRDLCHIDLSHNHINFNFFEILNRGNNSLRYTMIHSENTFSASRDIIFKPAMAKTLDLSHNYVDKMDISKFSKSTRMLFEIILNFYDILWDDNNVTCDCAIYALHNFLRRERMMPVDNTYANPRVKSSIYANLKCNKPYTVHGIPVVDLKATSIQCIEILPDCPLGCACYRRVIDAAIVVNCDKSQINDLPDKLPDNTLSLSIGESQLKKLSNVPDYLENLMYLNVSYNHITEISGQLFYKMSQNATLYLHGNKLRTLPKSVEGMPKGLKITLKDNRFICDCRNKWLYWWMLKYNWWILDVKEILCVTGNSQGQNMVDADVDDFVCDMTAETISGALGASCVSLILVMLVCYKYRGEIKLFLYTRFSWHPFDVTDEADVMDKEYDAFVSYNYKDCGWVCQTLRPKLETQAFPYRLCIHDRDFLVGAPIEENIMQSIKKSRRMILVLSPNFLKSDWCILEFRSAHLKVMKERSNYLIVVLYGAVVIDDLDDDLKLYLKTNTYLSVENKWFWDKLKYAMPQKPITELKKKITLNELTSVAKD